jgi:glutamyl endopeptidase
MSDHRVARRYLRPVQSGLVAIMLLAAAILGIAGASPASGATTSRSFTYQAHVQNYGWQGLVPEGQTAGTTGQGLRAEAFQFLWMENGAIWYVGCAAHVEGLGWLPMVWGPTPCGTTGQSRRIEAVRLAVPVLPPSQSGVYGIEYRCHVAGIGWTAWARDGATCGTTGQSRQMEAIQARLLVR